MNEKKKWKRPTLMTTISEPKVLLLVCTPPGGSNLCASGECVVDCQECFDNSTCGPG